MGQMKFTLSDEIEQWLRSKARKKGDLSIIVEKALREYREKSQFSKVDKI